MVGKEIHLASQAVWKSDVISIQDGNIGSFSQFKQAVPRRSQTTMSLKRDTDALIFSLVVRQNVSGLVRRAIVNKDVLEVAVRLIQYAFDGLGQVFLSVVDGCNDTQLISAV